MIHGIGTDLCDIRRIRETLARRGERFAEKVLGPHELAVFRERSARVAARGEAYLATRFAAKEAFSKAIGMGMRMPMTWRAMEVVKAPTPAANAPVCSFGRSPERSASASRSTTGLIAPARASGSTTARSSSMAAA